MNENKEQIPCYCGNPEAEWHGDKRGYRAYCCTECWQDDPTAFLGYHVTEYQAVEIAALWRKSWDSM